MSTEKMKVARPSAAEQLRTLATQLENGLIVHGDKQYEVPADVRLEIKVHKEEVEVEVKWKHAR